MSREMKMIFSLESSKRARLSFRKFASLLEGRLVSRLPSIHAGHAATCWQTRVQEREMRLLPAQGGETRCSTTPTNRHCRPNSAWFMVILPIIGSPNTISPSANSSTVT